jgi:ethanolamine ammonia-lyase small subunit
VQRTFILAGIAALLAFGAAQASAQDAAAQSFSQQQIEAFAGAAVEMRRLHAELGAQVREAVDGDEIARLQQEAQAEAVQIVEANGLSADEYRAIVAAAKRDPELHASIVALMQERSAP